MADEPGESSDKKKGISLDLDNLITDEPEGNVVVIRSADRRRGPAPSPESCSGSGDVDELACKTDADIKAQIERMSKAIPIIGPRLSDKGDKLRVQLQRAQDELERRILRRQQEDVDGWKKPVHPASSSLNGTLDGSKRAARLSQPSIMSAFGNSFVKKLDCENPVEQNTSDKTSKAFDRELSCLSRCDKRKRTTVAKSSQSKKAKSELPYKEFGSWKQKKGSRSIEKYGLLNLSRVPSTALSQEKVAGSFTDKHGSQTLNSKLKSSKKDETVVLVDEEEPEVIERKEEAEDLPIGNYEGKIYYPSREDPESLEIFRSELKCLEPGECLTSTIMNFYIRFLQELTAGKSQQNFYFFNTYFYSKLQEAVSYQKNDKEAFFIKFRRWWKGVNIFQKAYIFLPINEDNHWSLVIICIPDKEDESGPIVLHLDSLGLHFSGSIFGNIKSLLKNEWEYLKEDVDAVDVPIPNRIWKNLPRRIDDKIITVPRQTNDYDCGLFVLYYMERFIEQAPVRLKKQDLSMFSKKWFKPQDASGLRGKIKKILQEEFRKVLREDSSILQPVCLSANAETPNVVNHVNVS